MGKRIVIALGGNALGNTPYEQLALVTETAKPIVDPRPSSPICPSPSAAP